MRSSFICALLFLTLSASTSLAQQAVPDARTTTLVDRLKELIEREVKEKRIPALSIALVDDQRVIWSAGFGTKDKAGLIPANAETVYRVGSVSKLFTDVALLKLVEQGKIDLDAPVTTYLPDFKPVNKFNNTPLTLRMLTSHRSGLIREPPLGNYFDDTHPTLKQTVASITGTDLAYAPGTKIKYSNAAIAVVGAVIEKTQGEPFERYLEREILLPLKMSHSSFMPTQEVNKNLADAVMWTYHGREFPAPTFELGMAPAGSMYSTVGDLSHFLKCLFAEGKFDGKPFIAASSLQEMQKIQFGMPNDKVGFGIGFSISELDGHKRIGHGGAIYGFATELAALPSEKLGVIVTCSRDIANAVTTRIADDALRLMLATKAGRPLPTLSRTEPIDPSRIAALVGRYRSDEKAIDLTEFAGRLYLTPSRGGYRTEVRQQGPNLWADDMVAWGPVIEIQNDALKINNEIYRRVPTKTPPATPPARWLGLIGEYGWDHNTLYILERDGQLYALIEWAFLYPLKEESDTVFSFPDFGLYHGEKLIFTRDAKGRATKVVAAQVPFIRRPDPDQAGGQFRIEPQQPIADLRKLAAKATMPIEMGNFRTPDLVNLAEIDPSFHFDIRYATDNNFLGTPVYSSAKAFMQRPAAEALRRVSQRLAPSGYGLLIFDAYRPWAVSKIFWDATPEKYRHFVADPSKGSRHNRGCAVDLTLYDLKTGQPIEMPGGYDEFTDRSYPEYPGGTSRQRWARDLLRRAMQAEDFTVYEAEWWHFDYKDWRQYPLLNTPFEELRVK